MDRVTRNVPIRPSVIARRDGKPQAAVATAASETLTRVIGSAAVTPNSESDDQIATYRNALKEAREQFRASTERRSTLQFQLIETEEEIAWLRRAITALSAMCSEHSPFDDLGLTDAVKEVMTKERTLVTTTEVVQKLEEIGFNIKSRKNVQASVHTILQRLVERELIERVEDDGKFVKWRATMRLP
jgi:septal ring factor EnvC (AmiA/AmiB activator)